MTTSTKQTVCPKCGNKVVGYFWREEEGILGTYKSFKFFCFSEDGKNDYVLCGFFAKRFRVFDGEQ
jgi:hypothetical protein